MPGQREVRGPKPIRRGPKKAPGFRDPVLQDQFPLAAMPSTAANFDGVFNRNGVLPPDTNGDVGPSHYVQWVNLSLAVYSKSGALLYGPTNGNTIFSGFGAPADDQRRRPDRAVRRARRSLAALAVRAAQLPERAVLPVHRRVDRS